MALIGTKEIALGFKAPVFALPEPRTGKVRSLEELKGEKGTLVLFICNHCPYVIHVIEGIVKLAEDYLPKGVGFIAINANDILRYPDDSPEKMAAFADKYNFPFPYLFDETQETARSYLAECTPDFDLIDAEGRVIYRGRFDGARPGNDEPVTGADMRDALDRLLAGKPQKKDQIPSMGCSIKWKD